MRYVWLAFLFIVVAAISVLGFRGSHSTRPPLEVFPDMDRQTKYKPQQESPFFADGRTDRPLPANVVPRGRSVVADPLYLGADDHMFRGKTATGEFARGFPQEIEITNDLLARGRQRYDMFCAPCHGRTGDGNGITKLYGMGATPTYHDDRIRTMPEGEIYNTLTHGKNTMMGYGDRVEVRDRWAIVAYLRALQRAQQGTVDDVRPGNRQELGL